MAEQEDLFPNPPEWTDSWDGMPEFVQDRISSRDSITVHFRNVEDRMAFLKLIGEDPHRMKSIWYPKMEYLKQSVVGAPPVQVAPNKYPIYVISKGRWESPLTVRALDKLGISYRLVIEPQEREDYARVVDPAKILTLPFSNLELGSIPARNWVWENAVATGVKFHWILDDNIDGFYRLNRNLKARVIDENPFAPIERFVDGYANIALAGMNYEFLAKRRERVPPYVLNTRIYSCILLRNDIPYRWRGRYNEDTDLSLMALKGGWCTVLFNFMLAKKMPTMSMAGGNTDELYKDDGRLRMAQALCDQHPDVVEVSRKFGRWQHHVDYRKFRVNKLRPALPEAREAEQGGPDER